MCDDISQEKITLSLDLMMQNVNFIMSQFPKQSRWKEYPRENTMRATKVWANDAQTRLGGEFWTCDVIAHKTYCRAPQIVYKTRATRAFLTNHSKDAFTNESELIIWEKATITIWSEFSRASHGRHLLHQFLLVSLEISRAFCGWHCVEF